ncbi:site-specific tyrosine recombinase XerD [Gemmata obscuriglobus]|nr:site-specific tyrosine recombinase XerD [Gemmata obscuriglobus]VTS01883.1 catalytic phage domain protein : Uncharacterized protein OS=Rhodopirellula maiorica SM1 GN=RMSM_00903 PE=4 SV=1: Phage_integrase [Gemmata obscuriglobus UQM 2246]
MPKSPLFELDGESRTLAEWARIRQISPYTVWTRIHQLGWDTARALNTPAKSRGRRGRPKAGVPRACPEYKRHPSGRAYCRWKANGRRHERYFGKYGSAEAATAYRRFAAEWASGAYETLIAAGGPDGTSVASLFKAWVSHCERHYVKGGEQTSELTHVRAAARVAVSLYGNTPAQDFKPAMLRVCREEFVNGGLTRGVCNSYTARIVRCFRWCAAQSLVSETVYNTLKLVERLAPGRTKAPDRQRRKPTTDAQIESALACIPNRSPERRSRVVAMVRLQRLTGMRPGEVCAMVPEEIDQRGDVWCYEVGKANKNLHRGQGQEYFLGPQAVELLRPHLAATKPGEKVFPIDRDCYRATVKLAAVKAGVPVWTPHQLRHALATAVAERFRSLTHAAAAIGDSEAVAAAVYVHVDPKRQAKIEVARAMG